jgi:peptidylprolyl isomerase
VRTLVPALLAALLTAAPTLARPDTPGAIIARAPNSDWQAVDPNDLLVIDMARGRVVIQLAPGFAPVHVANIRALARAHWYDGLSIERVQDDYVVQWGDPGGRKVLPKTVVQPAPAEYERAAAGLKLEVLPWRDTFADVAGFSGGWPVAESLGKAWLTHCYSMVGAGRDNNPDTGTGAELYAVIGHAPRPLDRNIAVVGRVLGGMDLLSALPRGGGELGVYSRVQLIPIRRVRLAADLPAAERPAYEVLRTDSDTFRAWYQLKANRQDSFFLHPAGAIDVCSILPPLRSHNPPPLAPSPAKR